MLDATEGTLGVWGMQRHRLISIVAVLVGALTILAGLLISPWLTSPPDVTVLPAEIKL